MPIYILRVAGLSQIFESGWATHRFCNVWVEGGVMSTYLPPCPTFHMVGEGGLHVHGVIVCRLVSLMSKQPSPVLQLGEWQGLGWHI